MNELQGALRRHARAGEHLAQLQGVVAQIQQLCENGVLAEVDANGAWRPSEGVLAPLRLTAGVLVGEITHNLRSALDYLVYVLAEHDSGSPQKGTQFPIEDNPQGFTGRSPRYLKGVSDEHVAVIRQFQPFKGAEWALALRDIDNVGKHRELISVRVDQNVGSVLALTEYDLGGETTAEGVPPVRGVEMYLKGPAQVLLPEGRPVVDTLTEIQTQVGLVLYVFTHEFPGG